MQHTNTSSMSGGSTTSLLYRDLGARWLTTRSKKGIRQSNKNRLTLSNSPISGWWRPAWNLSFEGRVRNVAVGRDPDTFEKACETIDLSSNAWGLR